MSTRSAAARNNATGRPRVGAARTAGELFVAGHDVRAFSRERSRHAGGVRAWRWAAALVTLTLTVMIALGSIAGLGIATAEAANYPKIIGSGSTWSQNALDQWRRNAKTKFAMDVDYTGNGSSGGRQDFAAGTVDFAVSEIPFQRRGAAGVVDYDTQIPADDEYAYMPIVAGGTSFMYNLKIAGKRVTNLRLSGETVTKIFTGAITKWNDAAIKADNPQLALPAENIVPVVRSEGSGATAQFTLWMSKQYPKLWTPYYGHDSLTSIYPTGKVPNMKAQNGSLGVSGYISQSYAEGSIGYIEYSYALKAGFPVAKLLNASGYYVEPTSDSVAVGLLKAQINMNKGSHDYLTQILDGVYSNPDRRTYPLSSYSYMFVPLKERGIFTSEKGASLGTFTNYFLCEGQKQAPALGYSPLPMNLVIAARDIVKQIPGAPSNGFDINTCNNPTFKAGQDPSHNLLVDTAAYPQECDKKGPTQCATGTGGAAGTTTTLTGGSGGSGSGNKTTGGSGSNNSATTNNGATGDTSGGGDTSGQTLDADGVPVSGITGSATASPQTLQRAKFGTPQVLMLVSGALIAGGLLLPPFLSNRLKTAANPFTMGGK